MIATAILAHCGGWIVVASMMSLLMGITLFTTYNTVETRDRDLYAEEAVM